MKIKLSSKCN